MGVEALSSAVSGLFAHRRRLDVISHNVANSNTIGYSRQRADLFFFKNSCVIKYKAKIINNNKEIIKIIFLKILN